MPDLDRALMGWLSFDRIIVAPDRPVGSDRTASCLPATLVFVTAMRLRRTNVCIWPSMISHEGSGVLVFCRKKKWYRSMARRTFRAYRLQDNGLDYRRGNHALRFQADIARLRSVAIVKDSFLLTNNRILSVPTCVGRSDRSGQNASTGRAPHVSREQHKPTLSGTKRSKNGHSIAPHRDRAWFYAYPPDTGTSDRNSNERETRRAVNVGEHLDLVLSKFDRGCGLHREDPSRCTSLLGVEALDRDEPESG